MSEVDRFDVIVIGSGAGGGTLAWRLAPTGLRVLLLERGDYVPRERENWDSRAVISESRYKAKESWLDAAGRELHPGTHYNVGGNTKFYGAALIRFRPQDFGELRHHDGVSPAWPIGYDEFETYYTESEHLYQVHGERGADPTEGHASAPYLYPAVSHEPRIQEVVDGFRRLGHRPFPMPVGILLDEQRPAQSACIRCSTCDGFPCLVNAKADAQTICVGPALRHPNVTLRTSTLVKRLETGPAGREVTDVVVEREGREERYRGHVVVVAAGAVNSAALLLRSASPRHPNGLANGSGLVGRNYMCHNNSVLLAFSLEKNPTRFQKTLGMNDWYFGAPDFAFPLGHVSMVGKMDAYTLAEGAPPFAPHLLLDQMGKRSIDFWLTTEDLPNPENRVTLDRDGRIKLTYRENNLEPHRRLAHNLRDLVRRWQTGLRMEKGGKIPLAGVAHQCGTIRFGQEPETSVLDVNCRAHELDNLYVADASFFVSASAVNPALTIMANALRVGDHIAERFGVRAKVWVGTDVAAAVRS